MALVPLRASHLLLHSKLSNATDLSLQVMSVFPPSGKGISKQPPGSVGDISVITTRFSIQQHNSPSFSCCVMSLHFAGGGNFRDGIVFGQGNRSYLEIVMQTVSSF